MPDTSRTDGHRRMDRGRGRLVGALAAVLLGAGCAHPPPETSPGPDGGAVARSIALCRTTEAELRQSLGAPTREGLLRRDRVLSWIVSEDDVVRYLAVLVDARGVVVDLYWNLPTEIPWNPANQCGSAG